MNNTTPPTTAQEIAREAVVSYAGRTFSGQADADAKLEEIILDATRKISDQELRSAEKPPSDALAVAIDAIEQSIGQAELLGYGDGYLNKLLKKALANLHPAVSGGSKP